MDIHSRKKSVTARDVAQACGVSQATVSYVINNAVGTRISAETRKLVTETARRMGYVPMQSARSMRSRRAMAVGVVLGGNGLSIGVSRALRGVKGVLDAAGYSQLLLSDDVNAAPEDYTPHYRTGRVDGLIFMFRDISERMRSGLNESGVPYLSLNEQGIYGSGLEISSGYEPALRECAVHIRESGWRRVKFYSFRYGETLYSYKYDMFCSALRAECPDAEIRRVIFDAAALSDEELLGALARDIALRDCDVAITPHARLGWMVQNAILRDEFVLPQRIKHICLSTAQPFAVVYPSITMVDIPLTQLGECAARVMLNMLDPKKYPESAPADGEIACRLSVGLSSLYCK